MGLCYGANWYQDHSQASHELPPDNDQFGSAAGVPDGLHFPNFDFVPNDDHLAGIDQESGYDGMDAGDEQKFTETFPGCSDSYPGGLTFMDKFWQDEYANERQENLYFPFASGEEWKFSSWCLRSGLSIAAVDSLLSLSIVSNPYSSSSCN